MWTGLIAIVNNPLNFIYEKVVILYCIVVFYCVLFKDAC